MNFTARFLKKFVKWTFIFFGGLVAIALIANACFVCVTDSRLDQRRAAIREAGDPVSLSEIHFDTVPTDQNAVTYLRRAKEDLRAMGTEIDGKSIQGFDEHSPTVLKATKSAVAAYPKVLPLLEKAAECPGYSVKNIFGPTGKCNTATMVEAMLPRVQYNRSIARFLGGHWPRLLVSEGKTDEAVRADIAMLKLTRHYDREPALVGVLVALACRGVALDSLNEALQSGPVSDDVRQQLDDELAKHNLNKTLRNALKSERLFAFEYEMGGSGWLTRGIGNLMKLDHIDSVNWFLDQIPEDAAGFINEDYATEPPKTKFGPSIVPALEATISAVKRNKSKINAIRVLNALQRRADPEALPAADLSDLGLPKEATIDYFNGKPLLVKKVPGGWLVYSVGLNQKDDGGKINGEDDREPLDSGYGPFKKTTDKLQEQNAPLSQKSSFKTD